MGEKIGGKRNKTHKKLCIFHGISFSVQVPVHNGLMYLRIETLAVTSQSTRFWAVFHTKQSLSLGLDLSKQIKALILHNLMCKLLVHTSRRNLRSVCLQHCMILAHFPLLLQLS